MSEGSSGGKTFNIPKIKRQAIKDNLRTVNIESRDAKEVLYTIERSYLEGNYKGQWQVKSVQIVDNKELEENYRKKRSELKEEGRHSRDLVDQFAFLLFRDNNAVPKIAKEGLKTRPLPFNALGDSKLGLYLCRNADIQLRLAETWGIPACTLIVFKITQGRCKALTPQLAYEATEHVEPTPNYDCHVSQVVAKPNDPINIQLARSQIYLYEYNEDCEPSPTPRHCLPYAVLSYDKKEATAPSGYEKRSYPAPPSRLETDNYNATRNKRTFSSDSSTERSTRPGPVVKSHSISTDQPAKDILYQPSFGPVPQSEKSGPIPGVPYDPRMPDRRLSADGRPIDPRLVDPKSADPRLNRISDPRLYDPKTSDPRFLNADTNKDPRSNVPPPANFPQPQPVLFELVKIGDPRAAGPSDPRLLDEGRVIGPRLQNALKHPPHGPLVLGYAPPSVPPPGYPPFGPVQQTPIPGHPPIVPHGSQDPRLLLRHPSLPGQSPPVPIPHVPVQPHFQGESFPYDGKDSRDKSAPPEYRPTPKEEEPNVASDYLPTSKDFQSYPPLEPKLSRDPRRRSVEDSAPPRSGFTTSEGADLILATLDEGGHISSKDLKAAILKQISEIDHKIAKEQKRRASDDQEEENRPVDNIEFLSPVKNFSSPFKFQSPLSAKFSTDDSADNSADSDSRNTAASSEVTKVKKKLSLHEYKAFSQRRQPQIKPVLPKTSVGSESQNLPQSQTSGETSDDAFMYSPSRPTDMDDGADVTREDDTSRTDPHLDRHETDQNMNITEELCSAEIVGDDIDPSRREMVVDNSRVIDLTGPEMEDDHAIEMHASEGGHVTLGTAGNFLHPEEVDGSQHSVQLTIQDCGNTLSCVIVAETIEEPITLSSYGGGLCEEISASTEAECVPEQTDVNQESYNKEENGFEKNKLHSEVVASKTEDIECSGKSRNGDFSASGDKEIPVEASKREDSPDIEIDVSKTLQLKIESIKLPTPPCSIKSPHDGSPSLKSPLNQSPVTGSVKSPVISGGQFAFPSTPSQIQTPTTPTDTESLKKSISNLMSTSVHSKHSDGYSGSSELDSFGANVSKSAIKFDAYTNFKDTDDLDAYSMNANTAYSHSSTQLFDAYATPVMERKDTVQQTPPAESHVYDEDQDHRISSSHGRHFSAFHSYGDSHQYSYHEQWNINHSYHRGDEYSQVSSSDECVYRADDQRNSRSVNYSSSHGNLYNYYSTGMIKSDSESGSLEAFPQDVDMRKKATVTENEFGDVDLRWSNTMGDVDLRVQDVDLRVLTPQPDSQMSSIGSENSDSQSSCLGNPVQTNSGHNLIPENVEDRNSISMSKVDGVVEKTEDRWSSRMGEAEFSGRSLQQRDITRNSQDTSMFRDGQSCSDPKVEHYSTSNNKIEYYGSYTTNRKSVFESFSYETAVAPACSANQYKASETDSQYKSGETDSQYKPSETDSRYKPGGTDSRYKAIGTDAQYTNSGSELQSKASEKDFTCKTGERDIQCITDYSDECNHTQSIEVAEDDPYNIYNKYHDQTSEMQEDDSEGQDLNSSIEEQGSDTKSQVDSPVKTLPNVQNLISKVKLNVDFLDLKKILASVMQKKEEKKDDVSTDTIQPVQGKSTNEDVQEKNVCLEEDPLKDSSHKLLSIKESVEGENLTGDVVDEEKKVKKQSGDEESDTEDNQTEEKKYDARSSAFFWSGLVKRENEKVKSPYKNRQGRRRGGSKSPKGKTRTKKGEKDSPKSKGIVRSGLDVQSDEEEEKVVAAAQNNVDMEELASDDSTEEDRLFIETSDNEEDGSPQKIFGLKRNKDDDSVREGKQLKPKESESSGKRKAFFYKDLLSEDVDPAHDKDINLIKFDTPTLELSASKDPLWESSLGVTEVCDESPGHVKDASFLSDANSSFEKEHEEKVELKSKGCHVKSLFSDEAGNTSITEVNEAIKPKEEKLEVKEDSTITVTVVMGKGSPVISQPSAGTVVTEKVSPLLSQQSTVHSGSLADVSSTSSQSLTPEEAVTKPKAKRAKFNKDMVGYRKRRRRKKKKVDGKDTKSETSSVASSVDHRDEDFQEEGSESDAELEKELSAPLKTLKPEDLGFRSWTQGAKSPKLQPVVVLSDVDQKKREPEEEEMEEEKEEEEDKEIKEKEIKSAEEKKKEPNEDTDKKVKGAYDSESDTTPKKDGEDVVELHNDDVTPVCAEKVKQMLENARKKIKFSLKKPKEEPKDTKDKEAEVSASSMMPSAQIPTVQGMAVMHKPSATQGTSASSTLTTVTSATTAPINAQHTANQTVAATTVQHSEKQSVGNVQQQTSHNVPTVSTAPSISKPPYSVPPVTMLPRQVMPISPIETLARNVPNFSQNQIMQSMVLGAAAAAVAKVSYLNRAARPNIQMPRGQVHPQGFHPRTHVRPPVSFHHPPPTGPPVHALHPNTPPVPQPRPQPVPQQIPYRHRPPPLHIPPPNFAHIPLPRTNVLPPPLPPRMVCGNGAQMACNPQQQFHQRMPHPNYSPYPHTRVPLLPHSPHFGHTSPVSSSEATTAVSPVPVDLLGQHITPHAHPPPQSLSSLKPATPTSTSIMQTVKVVPNVQTKQAVSTAVTGPTRFTKQMAPQVQHVAPKTQTASRSASQLAQSVVRPSLGQMGDIPLPSGAPAPNSKVASNPVPLVERPSQLQRGSFVSTFQPVNQPNSRPSNLSIVETKPEVRKEGQLTPTPDGIQIESIISRHDRKRSADVFEWFSDSFAPKRPNVDDRVTPTKEVDSPDDRKSIDSPISQKTFESPKKPDRKMFLEEIEDEEAMRMRQSDKKMFLEEIEEQALRKRQVDRKMFLDEVEDEEVMKKRQKASSFSSDLIAIAFEGKMPPKQESHDREVIEVSSTRSNSPMELEDISLSFLSRRKVEIMNALTRLEAGETTSDMETDTDDLRKSPARIVQRVTNEIFDTSDMSISEEDKLCEDESQEGPEEPDERARNGIPVLGFKGPQDSRNVVLSGSIEEPKSICVVNSGGRNVQINQGGRNVQLVTASSRSASVATERAIPTLLSGKVNSPPPVAHYRSAAMDWSKMIQQPETKVECIDETLKRHPSNFSSNMNISNNNSSVVLSQSAAVLNKSKAKLMARTQIRTLGDWLRVELELDSSQSLLPLQKFVPYAFSTDFTTISKGRRRKIKQRVRNAIEAEGKAIKTDAQASSSSDQSDNIVPEPQFSASPTAPVDDDVCIIEPPKPTKFDPLPKYSPEVPNSHIKEELELVRTALIMVKSGENTVNRSVNIGGAMPWAQRQSMMVTCRNDSLSGPPGNEAWKLTGALTTVENDMKIMMQRTCYYGYPNRKVPIELLFDTEYNTYRSEEDVFLILMVPISSKPYNKLLILKTAIEKYKKTLKLVISGREFGNTQRLQNESKSLHNQRQSLLRSFTGFLNRKRITKLQEQVGKYSNALQYIKVMQPRPSDAQLKYLKTTLEDLKSHLLYARQYLTMEEQAAKLKQNQESSVTSSTGRNESPINLG